MNKFNNIFGQILQIFSKRKFYKAVMETKAERGAKGFTCWQQFVAMLFCQIGQAHSLREICGGLASCFGKLRHLGVKEAPNRSNLSYTNEHRPWQLYRVIFFKTIKQNFNIKTFVGTSPNALMIQIWTALIAVLLLKYLKLWICLSKNLILCGWSV